MKAAASATPSRVESLATQGGGIALLIFVITAILNPIADDLTYLKSEQERHAKGYESVIARVSAVNETLVQIKQTFSAQYAVAESKLTACQLKNATQQAEIKELNTSLRGIDRRIDSLERMRDRLSLKGGRDQLAAMVYAIMGLDPGNDDHWRRDGAPRVAVIEDKTGLRVNADERDTAWAVARALVGDSAE